MPKNLKRKIMSKCFLILLAGCVLPVAQCWADAPSVQTVTVLFNEAAVEIKDSLVEGDQLWVAVDQVHHVNGFDPKPEGFCSAELCIPVPKSTDWRRQHEGREYFNVTRLAAKFDQAVAVDKAKSIWSFGEVPLLSSRLLPRGIAPDFELPDRQGKLVKLSDFSGKKVLLLTWASW